MKLKRNVILHINTYPSFTFDRDIYYIVRVIIIGKRFVEQKAEQYSRYLTIALMIVVFLSLALLLTMGWSSVPFIMFLLISLSPLVIYAERYSKGAEGERKIEESLKGVFDDSFILIGDLRLPGIRGNIDYVLVCPKGVFIIEVKNYSGYIVCEGDKWYKVGNTGLWYEISSISKQVKFYAAYLGNFLRKRGIKVWVNPLIVFTDSSIRLELRNPTVKILKLEELAEYITKKEDVLTLNEVNKTVDNIIMITQLYSH